MKRIALAIFLSFVSLLTSFAVNTDSILHVLDRDIDHRQCYYSIKQLRIDSLKSQLQFFRNDRPKKIQLYKKLFDEYDSYNYDSAYTYVEKLKNEELVPSVDTKCKLIYSFISSGLNKEAYEMLKSIDPTHLSADDKINYFAQCERFYYEMSDCNTNPEFKKRYDGRFLSYCDSSLYYTKPNTPEYKVVLATKYLKDNRSLYEKIDFYHNLLQTTIDSDPLKPSFASQLGNMYAKVHDDQKAIYYLALSAILDIRQARRENTSKTDLALLLYKKGQIKRAGKYIQVALEDANFYNARHRKVEINSVFPDISKAQLKIIENKNLKLAIFLGVSLLLLLLLIGTIFIIYKQMNKIKASGLIIKKQIDELREVNKTLNESNVIKDHYLIQTLYEKSKYLEDVESILKTVTHKLATKQYADLTLLFKDFNLKSERSSIYSAFDEAMLRLFPDFVEQYNCLFDPKDRIVLADPKELNTELRIFALIRLGFDNNEQISVFLNLSVNTIYTYKAKAKNRTIVPKEEFEYRLKNIR